jgi:GT2 family glycosyltransferase
MMSRTTIVVATRNRRASLVETLSHHRVPVIVVDNGSEDGTADLVRSEFPDVEVIALGHNIGAPARNVGVCRARTPFVAFADDDSWWAPEALAQAEELFDEYPRLGLIAAAVLVGVEERLDPTSRQMSDSALGAEDDLPGPSVLGFLACGAVVRKDAFIHAGGFDEVVFFVGEEERLALDLMAAGWGLSYVASVVAHHYPAGTRDPVARRELQIRNVLLTALMRRPWHVVGALTWQALHCGSAGRHAVLAAARRSAMALRTRGRTPAAVERARCLLEGKSSI